MQNLQDLRLKRDIGYGWSPHQPLSLPLRRTLPAVVAVFHSFIQVIEQNGYGGVALPLSMAERGTPISFGRVLVVSGRRLYVGDKYVQLCVWRSLGVPCQATTRCVAQLIQVVGRQSIPLVSAPRC